MTSVNDINSPFRSPFGEILGLFGNCQTNFRCRELELNVLDCTDVYGHKGLKRQCKNEYDDYMECVFSKKQIERVEAMKQERMRQYLSGERSKKNLYAETPKMDSFHKTYGMSIE